MHDGLHHRVEHPARGAATIELRGMTWSHPRGYAPLVATAQAFAGIHPGVRITWDNRSLQAFADHPMDDLAARYDLIVIDHPHVGMVAREGCLVPLDQTNRSDELATLARQSLGGSHESYQWAGHQWALAIDAAAQVAAHRADLLPAAPTTWDEVIALAHAGRVLWPAKPVDALMSFFTLCANLGAPCATGQRLCDGESARQALTAMRELANLVPAACLAMNPIETLDQLTAADNDRFAYCPLLYGYTNYSRAGYASRRVDFADIPILGNDGPRGSTLGGTGIAVSSRCTALEMAVEYAFWIAGAECQRSLYFDANGQPGNSVAWNDEHCNRVAGNFFRNTRATLDSSFIRPRHDGYMAFQDRAGTLINEFLAAGGNVDHLIDRLESAFAASFTKTCAND